MKRYILAATVILTLAGCGKELTFQQEKAGVKKQWSGARSSVSLRVAEDRLQAGALDDAQKAAEQALQAEPDNNQAKLVLARVMIEKSRYRDAIGLLEQVERNQPRDAKAVYLLGVAQEKSGLLEEALASYRRAYGMDESDLSPVKAAAEVLVAMGQVRPAMLQVESYIAKAQNDPAMFELAGRLAMMCKQYAQAADYLQHARDMDFRNVRYAEMLARAQHAAGRYDVLVETLTDLMAKKDYEVPTWAYLMLGDAQLSLRQGKEAFNAYFTASEREPGRAEIWLSLARAALVMNDTVRAVGSAQRAVAIRPNDVDAQSLLGYALMKDKQPARAVLVLSDAATAHPDSATIQCLLGRAHAAAGNQEEAIRCYGSALRIEPGNVLAKELLASASEGVKLTRAD